MTIPILFKYLAISISLFIFYGIASCFGQSALDPSGDCIRHFPAASINWTSGIVTAKGTAAPAKGDSYELVHKAALYDAEAQILTILKQIRINNRLTVGEYASANPGIMTGLEQFSHEAAISKQIYTSAMTVDITLETNIFGAFLQLVLPEEIRQLPLIKPAVRQADDIQADDLKDKKPYTGLIVDARGLGFDPVLDPVIINDHGQEVYSSAFISREYAIQGGVCKYISHQDKALQDPRIGAKPLILNALRREGKKNATLVISMADYEILEKVTERHSFFSECRVIIILE